MTRPAQAFSGWCRRVFGWLNPAAGLCLAAVLALSGCGAAGFSIESAIDRSVETSSVNPSPTAASGDASGLSDETTIRNAVSSAIVDEIGEDGIGWANARTGSRGSIRDVRESRRSDGLCRSFTASRESFDGVHLHRGVTCLNGAGLWVMKSFEPVK